ncbi:MAG: DNA polymerase III subunit delta [Ruminiclostridium sp.]|nr:DNA polymerase III subunit delta [Ruminiclostridium sp.]
MAKAKKDKSIPKFIYGDEVRKLRQEGPRRLYFIWGPEDYLSDQFVGEIRKLCVPEGTADFSYHKLSERDYSPRALADAIDSVPFLTERTMVELRGIDLNRLTDDETEALFETVKDIPDYCTVVFVEPSEFEPDKRRKVYKKLLKDGTELFVNAQAADALVNWVGRRFAALGKRIETNAIQRLIFVSGNLMNMLIPEIEKIAGYAKGDVVTTEDVDAVAHHIPEAVVFEMVECLGAGETGKAMFYLDELLGNKDCDENFVIAVLGIQMRKVYAARMAIDGGGGKDYLMKNFGIPYESYANKYMNAARRYSPAQLRRAVELCAETDYKLKSSGVPEKELIKECVMRIAVGEGDV